MKKTLVIAACTLALAGSALSQTSSQKPSGAIRENPAAEQRQRRTQPVASSEVTRSSTPELRRRATNGLSIPIGTALRMKLDSGITTGDVEGEKFSGSVTEAVVVDGRTLIPAGAIVSGNVVNIAQPRRIAGAPGFDLRPQSVTMPDGQTFSINATVVDTGNPQQFHVNDEGRITGKARTGKDNVELAGATGSGAVAGAVIGGGVGSAVGAAIGAGASTGHWLLKRHSAEIPAGTEIILEFGYTAGDEEAVSGGE